MLDECAAATVSLPLLVVDLTARICSWRQALTVNLHLLLASFYRPNGDRTKILMEAGAFPSDQYAAATQCLHHGLDPESTIVTVSPREGERLLRTDDIIECIRATGERLALVVFSGVHYGTGQVFDMAAITAAAHATGAVVGLDLAHAVGNVRLKLHDWAVDWACWCGYKYVLGNDVYFACIHTGPRAVVWFTTWGTFP